MIQLIARKKLLEYLHIKPGAQTPLLISLKENYLDNYCKRRPEAKHYHGQIGASKYYIDIQLNTPLQIAYVTRIGTREEREREIEQQRVKDPEIQTEKTISTRVILSSPPPVDTTNKDKLITEPVPGLPLFTDVDKPQLLVETFKTQADYEKAIDRALNIFDSNPGTPEFEELSALIPLITSYESQHFNLPELTLYEAIKSRMESFEILPEQLPEWIGSSEEINLFLSGQKSLPEDALRTLLKMLSFRFTI